MSQATQREKARTRASTSGVPTSGRDTDPLLPATQTEGPADEAPTDMAAISRATIDRFLQRLDCLDQVKSDIASMNDSVAQFRDKHAKDAITADLRSVKQTKDIDHLTALLEESRRTRTVEEREHLITRQELATTRELNRRMAVQLNDIENRQRCCNACIEGVEETDREEIRRTVLEIAAAIGANTITHHDIVSTYRMGKIASNAQNNVRQKSRPIFVAFTTLQKRNEFYYARSKLRNSEKYRRVYINDDVTAITKKLRDDYKAVANIARDDGVEVRIHSDGIVLNGRKHYLSDPHTLPDKYSLESAKTVEVGGEIYFASEHSFLSNFASSPITEGTTVYATAEHMYQAHKCRRAGELERMDRVILAPTPLEAKRVADSVPETPEWRANREEVMINVVACKFDQNPLLATKLIKTGNLKLNEATHNTFFGIGAPLHAREIREKSYRGENRLGHILANKRANLQEAQNTG